VRVVHSTPYEERQLFVIHIRPRENTAVTIVIENGEGRETYERNETHQERSKTYVTGSNLKSPICQTIVLLSDCYLYFSM
jgi:hypothetical protein